MNEPLKPCPFCGQPATKWYAGGDNNKVGCSNPKCPVHPRTQSTCENTAIRKWNTRHSPLPQHSTN